MIPVQLMLTHEELDLLRDLATVLRPGGPAWEASERWDLDKALCEALAEKLAVAQEPQRDDLARLAKQLYPERPINLPDGGAAVVVPTPERRAFIAGAAWQASQVQAVLEPFARKADAVSLSDALGHIEREHLTAARDFVDDQWA